MADFRPTISLSEQVKISESDNSSPEHQSPVSATHKPNTLHRIHKPKGRPRGSKNKPKPPIYITTESSSSSSTSMKSVVLEVPAGSCVIQSITNYARKLKVGITVLNVSGSVTNVTLRSSTQQLVLRGSYYLLSLTGSYVASINNKNNDKGVEASFGVTLAGLQGHAIGGTVSCGNKLTAATAVVVMAAIFDNPVYHVLSCDDHENDGDQDEGGGGATPISCQVATGGDTWTTHGRSSFN
ncbi:hypothetical protein ACFE04_028977 [Oxalis oulophora]